MSDIALGAAVLAAVLFSLSIIPFTGVLLATGAFFIFRRRRPWQPN